MKIYLNKIREDWIVDRFYKEWYKNNAKISTNLFNRSDSVWIIAPWMNIINFNNL